MLKQAVVLVGGRGTRLGPLTDATPKPLLHVGGHPFLDYQLDRLRDFGITELLLLAGYHSAQIDEWAADRSNNRLNIRVVTEDEPAGTGGALKLAVDHLSDIFLLLNGDSVFDANWLAGLTVLSETDTGVLLLRELQDTGRYGRVDLDGSRIRAFREKASERTAGFVNAGVYILRKSVVDTIATLPNSLENDVFPVLAAEDRLAGLTQAGEFIDIGIPDDFSAAQDIVPAMRIKPVALIAEAILTENLPHAVMIRRLGEVGYATCLVSDGGEARRAAYNARLQLAGAHIDLVSTPKAALAFSAGDRSALDRPTADTGSFWLGPANGKPGLPLISAPGPELERLLDSR